MLTGHVSSPRRLSLWGTASPPPEHVGCPGSLGNLPPARPEGNSLMGIRAPHPVAAPRTTPPIANLTGQGTPSGHVGTAVPQAPLLQAAQGVCWEPRPASRGPRRNVPDGREAGARGTWALTVHAGGPGSGGARDLPLSAGTAGRLPGDCPPRLAAVAVQRHNLTGAGGQLTCKRRTGELSGRAPGTSPRGAHAAPAPRSPPHGEDPAWRADRGRSPRDVRTAASDAVSPAL